MFVPHSQYSPGLQVESKSTEPQPLDSAHRQGAYHSLMDTCRFTVTSSPCSALPERKTDSAPSKPRNLARQLTVPNRRVAKLVGEEVDDGAHSQR